jgi:Tol biopolymer transport system component
VKTGAPFRLLVYDVDAPQQPRDLGETYKLSGAAWSPDGEHMAVGRSGAPDPEAFIEILPADGGAGREVAAGYVSKYPQFSPDGLQLAFLARGAGSDAADLYLTSVDGGAPRMLASVGMNIFSIAWSPDGSYLAFTAGPVTADGCGDD